MTDALARPETRPRPKTRTAPRTRARAAARLAAVQALYQHDMEGTAVPALLHEFHHHRLGATIEGAEYLEADRLFFDDVVRGAAARIGDLDAAVARRLPDRWSLDRLDRPMKAILRAGTYELSARADVPVGAVISQYVDVAHAFYERREAGFVNAVLDAVAGDVRAGAAPPAPHAQKEPAPAPLPDDADLAG